MKKIDQGRYEIFTTKEDAIRKFMQLQGTCREELSDDNKIMFYCSKKGKIIISNPHTRHIEHSNSTDLFAEIISENGKTYVSYDTKYSQFNNVLKIIFLAISVVAAIASIVLTILHADKTIPLGVLIVILLFWSVELYTSFSEGKTHRKIPKL